MAESWTQSFGRYLKALRDRRGLSLRDVVGLSQAFADSLNKGYLSRCENGHQRLAFSKVIPLSRIYHVPADVLLERMELDMELERNGAPETEGMTFDELTEAGGAALKNGERWNGYGYLRDAVARATIDPVSARYRDRDEQVGCAIKNCGTAARALGRYRFALHEWEYLETAATIGPRFLPVLLERLATIHGHLGNQKDVNRYLKKALEAADCCDSPENVGYVYLSCALDSNKAGDRETALEMYKRAYEAFRNGGGHYSCALTLNNLAQLYFDLNRYGAARRSIEACRTIAKKHGHRRLIGLNLVLEGELDAKDGHREHAVRCWEEAATIARQLSDRVLRFKAEYLLLQDARDKGRTATARTLQRRLEKLANYVPPDVDELRSFELLVKTNSEAS